MGLNFFRQSRRFVEPEIARAIAAGLPAGVMKVGVFVNHDAAEIVEVSQSLGSTVFNCMAMNDRRFSRNYQDTSASCGPIAAGETGWPHSRAIWTSVVRRAGFPMPC